MCVSVRKERKADDGESLILDFLAFPKEKGIKNNLEFLIATRHEKRLTALAQLWKANNLLISSFSFSAELR